MKQGKDRAKHDGGKDASGKVPDGAKHPESEHPWPWHQPESGADSDRRADAGKRTPKEEED
jgi:hypothetical protein